MRKVLIANRGEIACRIIRSCKSLGIQTVAIYSDADTDSLHVELADQAIHVGKSKAADSYLRIDKILAAVKMSGADAVHPGYGFLSENNDFARALTDIGVVWVGPAPETIEAMGDKARARSIAIEADVPVLPGSERFSTGELNGIEQAGDEVGFPLLVKASAGGGGIGMRLVGNHSELRSIAESTQSMAERSFGDGSIFLERYVNRARHIEVQVFGFGDGRVIHLYERECSIQRRFQKIIEESPAPGLSKLVRADIVERGRALAADQCYLGAGTVEFILDDDTDEFFFLEMNTRIQVEHPVTEMTTNTDLVGMQIRLAYGDDLSGVTQESIEHRGCAIESRIYAENPEKMFLPCPGTLDEFSVPSDEQNVRLDTGVRAGDKITAYYDPMIAKLICFAESRESAIERSIETIKNSRITGVISNAAFLQKTLSHEAFRAGDLFTGFIDAHKKELLTSEVKS